MKIKVLSLNTWMGGLLWQPCYDFVTSQQADIILLQEVYVGTAGWYEPRFRSKQLFEAALHEHHSYFVALIGDQRQKEGLVDNGNLILSRWPLVEQETLFFDQPYAQYDHDRTTDYTGWPAAAQKAIVQLPNQTKIQLINIHGPVWNQGAEPTIRRLAMTRTLDRLLKLSMPTIIAGDSNATPDNPCWQLLTEPHASVFDQLPVTTFNMRRKKLPGFASAPVDVFMVTPEIKVASSHILDLDISDHLPMMIELEVSSPTD